MTSLAWAMRFGSAPDSLSIWAAVLIGASGLRSSWASMARNWSFWRFAARSSSSICLRRVTSLPSTKIPTTAPEGSRIGW